MNPLYCVSFACIAKKMFFGALLLLLPGSLVLFPFIVWLDHRYHLRRHIADRRHHHKETA